MCAYVFVDAENHFIRSSAAAEDVIGSPKAAQALSVAKIRVHEIVGFPNHIQGERFGWNPDLQLFWDCEQFSRSGILTSLGANLSRIVYSCSCTGDDDKAHEMRVKLRKYDFEPIVIREPNNLKAHRHGTLKQQGLIEKAKGCDIAIATRLVADTASD